MVPYDPNNKKGCPEEAVNRYNKWTEEFSFLPNNHFKPFKNSLTLNDKGVQAKRRIIMMYLIGQGLVMDKSGQMYQYLSNQKKNV